MDREEWLQRVFSVGTSGPIRQIDPEIRGTFLDSRLFEMKSTNRKRDRLLGK